MFFISMTYLLKRVDLWCIITMSMMSDKTWLAGNKNLCPFPVLLVYIISELSAYICAKIAFTTQQRLVIKKNKNTLATTHTTDDLW